MNRAMLTPTAQAAMEKGFELDRRAWQLLDLVAAEFASDPSSTACFDSRIVKEIIEIIPAKKLTEKQGIDPFSVFE